MSAGQRFGKLLLPWLLVLVGCSSQHKMPPSETEYASLSVGKTTYAEAIELLGDPSRQIESDGKLTGMWEWGSDSKVDLKRYIPIVGIVLANKKTSFWSETIKLEFDPARILSDVQRETDFRPNIQ